MYSLVQSLRAKGHSGEPLPTAYPSLSENDVLFNRGQLVLIASAPGVGKSVFALSIALWSTASTLYLSADSGPDVQLARSYAMATGQPMSVANQTVQSGDWQALNRALGEVPLKIDYSASPTPQSIRTALDAYTEQYGEFPELVIVDNVLDVVMEEDEESDVSTSDSLTAYLHDMARSTSACIIGLHHVTGPYNDGDVVVPLTGLKGQIGRVPEMVLTLSEGLDMLCVSPVKNRTGFQDKTGNSFLELGFDKQRVAISDGG